MAIFNSYVSLPEGNLGFHGNISGSHGNSMELYGLNVDLVGEIGISIITMGGLDGIYPTSMIFPGCWRKELQETMESPGQTADCIRNLCLDVDVTNCFPVDVYCRKAGNQQKPCFSLCLRFVQWMCLISVWIFALDEWTLNNDYPRIVSMSNARAYNPASNKPYHFQNLGFIRMVGCQSQEGRDVALIFIDVPFPQVGCLI